MKRLGTFFCALVVGCSCLLGLPAAGFAPSGPGSALDFNGTNGYVSFAPDTWFSGDFTVEGWVYVRSYNNWSRLIDFGNGPDNNIVYLALTAGTGGLPTVGVFTNNNGTPVFSASTTLPLNQWVHLALTASGTTGTIYINGVAQGAGTLNVAPSVVRTNNYLGRSNYGGDAYANAIFDEVRIWNMARTAAQIQRTMQYSLPPTSTNVIANWKFNENGGSQTYDSSGNAHTGVLSNGVNWVNSTAPIVSGFGSAVNFDGSQFVNVPHQATLNAYPLTVMTWFKTAQGGTVPLVNKYVSSSYNGFQLFLGGGQLRGWFIRDTTNSIFAAAAGAPAANDLQWHQAAFTVDATGGRLYLDGVLLTNTPWVGTPGPVTTTQPVSFALYPGDSLMVGQMDEVSVWNTALSPEKIRLYATGGLIGVESNLVAYYRLDEGGGTFAVDASGHGNTGTRMGGGAWVTGPPQPFFNVVTIGSSFITTTNALLSGAVNPMGLDTTAWFEYGTTTNYGSNGYTISFNSGTFLFQGLAVLLDGLDSGTFYHYRLVATNSLGTNYGADMMLLTGGLTVTNFADSGPGTLRQCIADSGNGGVIPFALDGTVLLTSQLTITNELTIRGRGTSANAVSGNLATRVFNIASGAAVDLQGLTIQDGRASGAGGGILNAGSLTLSNCVVMNNHSASGGDGSPSVNGSPGTVGGGIYNNAGNLYLLNSAFSGNVAGNGGRGGNAGTGTAKAGNGAAGGSGGAVYNTGTVTAFGCTFTGNAGGNGGNGGDAASGLQGNGGSGGSGGAIGSASGFTMTLCTVDGNSVGAGGKSGNFFFTGTTAAPGAGGGILNNGTFSLTASTVSRNNGLNGLGAGIRNANTLSARSSLIAANINAPGAPDVFGPVQSQGHNLLGNGLGSSGLTNLVNADLVGSNTNVINAGLNLLANNGGLTFTASLQPASPALENGDDSLIQLPLNLTLDQRGKPRLSGGHVDIGAVEAVVGVPTLLLNPILTTNNNFSFSFSNTSQASFTVMTTTNLALPWSNWNALTGAIEVSPGYFQFTDGPQTNSSMRFYNVRSP